MAAPDRREVRARYRELIAFSNENRDSIRNTTGHIKRILDTADALHDTVTKPREHAADTELLYSLATSGLSAAKMMSMGKRLNTPKDLVHSLKAQFASSGNRPDASSPTQMDWCGVASFASEYLNACGGVNCILGPIDSLLPAPARKARQANATRQPLGELVNPDIVDSAAANGGEEKQEMDRNLEQMLTILRGGKVSSNGAANGSLPEVHLRNLVMNHESFAQTVENIFTLSFLVKDGRARLSRNTDGEVTVRAVMPGGTQEVGEVAQFVGNFTMKRWKLMKERLEPGECLMGHRSIARSDLPVLTADGRGTKRLKT